MPNTNSSDNLLESQYKDASNLKARGKIHKLFSVNKYEWKLWVFDQFNLPSECRILDLGCGTGALWVENKDRIPEGWDITLSDFSIGILEEAKRNLAEIHHRFKFRVIDSRSIPLEDESFHVIIANQVLHHIPELGQALSEIYRVLKYGGYFYATTAGRTHMQEARGLIQRFDPGSNTKNLGSDIFGLENGTERLSKYFGQVTLRRRWPESYRSGTACCLCHIHGAFRPFEGETGGIFKDDPRRNCLER